MIAILLALALIYPTKPDRDLTPGAVRGLSVQTVCSTRWGLDRRMVTEKMKAAVAAKYGIPWESPKSGRLSARAKRLRARVEIDHVIPRSLAGQDSELNLWPQSWTGPYGAHQKDVLENELHRRVCRGDMTLEFAQTAIKSDWMAAYRLYVKR